MNDGPKKRNVWRHVSRASWRWLMPLAAATLPIADVSAQQANSLDQFLRRHHATEHSLRRLLSRVRVAQATNQLDWQNMQTRARWSGVAPQVRLRVSRGLDDVLRARSAVDQNSTGQAVDINSTASASQGREVAVELKWTPSTLIFHPSEVRLLERRMSAKSSNMAHRIRIARVFMARRALLIRYHRSVEPDIRSDLLHQILAHEFTLDVETQRTFSKLRKVSSK